MKKISPLRFAMLVTSLFVFSFFYSCNQAPESDKEPALAIDSVILYENPMGIVFSQEEMGMMKEGLENNLRAYQMLREKSLPNEVAPALRFDPVYAYPGEAAPDRENNWNIPDNVALPENPSDLAFFTLPQLASLIRGGKISSEELTRFFLDRLRKYDPQLHCVISYTEEYALDYARKMDQEAKAGQWRGPLHGIPYGIKDLFAFPGYKTTWGAGPYKDQVLDTRATVIKKLEDAGAVLIAKLSLGALAMGDVWFNDTTRNPWNLDQGSSGSSAGSAAATAAGLVPFAIGTETLGSIVSPSTRCGVTGLRPSYGRVSRYGAMALSWSMDKVGPICKNAYDCALVFHCIYGPDQKDLTVKDLPFNYPEKLDVSSLRVGYYKKAFDEVYRGNKNDRQSLEVLKKMGIRLVPFDFPEAQPVEAMRIILTAEAAAAFDELTLSNRDTLLRRQDRYAWPNTFRIARFIPAVEYIQANRFRSLLMEDMDRLMRDFDVVVSPSYGGNQLLITNLTGNPCVVVPNGFDDRGSPTSISFIGKLFDEGTLLAFARLYQDATGFDELHPEAFSH